MRLNFSLVVLLTLASSTAFADGLFYQLPDDRTWARYDIEVTHERDGMQETQRATLTMASVGKALEGTEQCRWIEVKLQVTNQGMEHTILAKVLIPEKYLKRGEAPLEQMVRGWLKGKETEEAMQLEASNFGPLRAFLAGPLNDEKKLEKELVESKLGKLECEGVEGWAPITEGNREGRFVFQSRLHPMAPFGLVSSRLKFEFKRDGQVVETGNARITLSEFGKEAVTELPGNL